MLLSCLSMTGPGLFRISFALGALLIIAEDLPFIRHFLATPAWTHFATWMVGG